MIKFEVIGKPKAKQRPRMMKAGFAYTPKETIAFENWVKLCFVNSSQEMLDGTLKAKLTFIYEIPKSKSKSVKEGMVTGSIRPVTRPDLDNLAKSILDSLNGVAYKDDSQIVELTCIKVYGDCPKTIVEIERLLCQNC